MASAAASEPAVASGTGPDAPKETLFAEIQDKLRDECHRVSQQLLHLVAPVPSVLRRLMAPPAATKRYACAQYRPSARDPGRVNARRRASRPQASSWADALAGAQNVATSGAQLHALGPGIAAPVLRPALPNSCLAASLHGRPCRSRREPSPGRHLEAGSKLAERTLPKTFVSCRSLARSSGIRST